MPQFDCPLMMFHGISYFIVIERMGATNLFIKL